MTQQNRRRLPVPLHELETVFRTAQLDLSPLGRRDTCLIALLCGEGIPDTDIASLTLHDYQDNVFLFGGHADRTAGWRVTLAQGSREALRRWLEIRDRQPGPLINPLDRQGRPLPRAISRTAINMACARRTQQAGIAPFTSDDILRTTALLHCSVWKAGCCPREGPKQLLALGESESTPGAGMEPQNHKLVISFLSRHPSRERSRLLTWLNRFANLVSGGTATAFTFNWLAWAARGENPAMRLSPPLSCRELHQVQNAVTALLAPLAHSVNLPFGMASPRSPAAAPAPAGEQTVCAREVRLAMESCMAEGTTTGARDAVLYGLLWETACSIGQAIRLLVAEAKMRACIHHTSANASACLGPLWQQALAEWLSVRRDSTVPELFLTIRRGQGLRQRPMHARAATYALEKRRGLAGFGGLTAEAIRRAAVRHVVESAEYR